MKLERIQSALPRPYAPQSSDFTGIFWEALEDGEFRIVTCGGCGRLQFPPRPNCPGCGSKDLSWQTSRGRGTLYSRTRVHAAGGPFACMTPYSVGLVDLEEGVRVLTRLMPDASSLPLDSPVQLAVLDHTDGALFVAVSAHSKKDPT